MRSLFIKIAVLGLLAAAVMLVSLSANEHSAKAVTTYWYKITPNTCSIRIPDGVDIVEYGTGAGDLEIANDTSGTVELEAYCPVHLPDGAVANLLRIRDFQVDGLPAYTDIYATFKRRSWDNSVSTLAAAELLTTYEVYDDVSFSSTISNENYQYLVYVRMVKSASATASPVLSMIEIRYAM